MNSKSVTALMAAVILSMALVVAIAVGAFWIVPWYGALRSISIEGERAILISYYLCTIPALSALFSMFKLLQKIKSKHPFEQKNVTYLRVISWCCLLVAVICAVGGVWYQPLYFVCASMLFLFLVVRVVCGCFSAAFELQQDNDLTV